MIVWLTSAAPYLVIVPGVFLGFGLGNVAEGNGQHAVWFGSSGLSISGPSA